MSATQELIAAALTAADELDEIFGWMKATKSRTAADLREACARAMVQPAAPDMAEVELLVEEYGGACCTHFRVSALDPGNNDHRAEKDSARTALLDYVRQGFAAAPQPVGAAEVPMPGENILMIRALDSAEVRWIGREALRTYGDAREAAGYAAGVAAGGKDAERYRVALIKLSCLGNGDKPGNSEGNEIARAALRKGD